jgi:acyl-CoA synthetase (AMP-forming)/AMP-acid ligase II
LSEPVVTAVSPSASTEPTGSAAPAANANIARHLALIAAAQPDQAALKIPRGRTAAGKIDYLTLSFAELDAEVSAWGHRLTAAGVQPGDRTLVMVKQGLPLIAAVFALFRLGAVPVVIDPGMGLKNFLACVARSRPRVLLGIPLAQLASHLFRSAFSSVKIRVPASGSATARLPQSKIENPKSKIVTSAPTDLAAILFTSGSTGAPKGVCYEHGMFEAQVRLIRETYGVTPGEIDLPMLPIFALFNPALGMTTVVPEIDPRRPAEVDPAKIVQAILQENVTNSFGSPTLWLKVSEYCRRPGIKLPNLLRVLSAGAPVPAALWENSLSLLPNGRLHSPYGATEALPVASVSSSEIDLASVRGACVGRPLPGLQVKIIRITDAPIATLEDIQELPTGETGEIIVQGPVVTRTYDDLPEATAMAKIQSRSMKSERDSSDLRISDFDLRASPPSGGFWHRMGDCGYLDYSGRLWFCGRKAERVETAAGPLFTEPCEQVFRLHPRVTRCALIGLGPRGQQRPALVIEAPAPRAGEARAFAGELCAVARQHPHTSAISLFFFHPEFPVDVRHNAKIHRLTLAEWAATAKGFTSDE